MSRLAPWKVAVISAALVASPLVASAQSDPQGGTPPQQQQQQTPPQQQQPPATSQPPQGTGQEQAQGQSGNPQTQGTEAQRQAALARLTAARQDLADITKLPAAAQIQGQARNDLNQLITNFNTLITSKGPEWRQAFDSVQGNLSALLGPESAAGSGQAPVGTSGAAVPSLDPSIVAKLTDLRQQIDQFGEIVGVKPGESALAQGQNSPGAQGATGTSGAAGINAQALRTNIDQIGSIVSRLLSQGTADQQTLTVSRQDLQQIQQYLDQLRQSIGGQQSSIK